MSGGLFADQLLREIDRPIDATMIQRLRARYAEAYHRLADDVVPLPGAKELLDTLTAMSVPWAIATSGRIETAGVNLRALGVDPDKKDRKRTGLNHSHSCA